VITRSLRRTNGVPATPSARPRASATAVPLTERRVQALVTNTGPFDNFFAFQRTLQLRGTALARFERPYTPFD
jgi:hypothetical protein